MIAIDTNILVRYLTGDNPAQSRMARVLVDRAEIFVGRTVMLESEWVLRSVYGYTAGQVCRALRAFAGLPRVTVESPAVLAQALDLAERGMDFADALHLLAATDCEAMATFDRGFIKAAKAAGLEGVEEPP